MAITLPALNPDQPDERVWLPDAYELILEAMERCGLNKEADSIVHLNAAVRSLQFIATEFSTQKAYLPAIFEYSFDTEAGERDYVLPKGTLEIIVGSSKTDNDADVIMRRMSYEEWQAIPYKEGTNAQQERPYAYFLDKRAAEAGPMLRLYYLPDLSYKISLQLQMMPKTLTHALDNVETAERWYEAFAACLAAKLAVKFMPDRIEVLQMAAQAAVEAAKQADRTGQPMVIHPRRVV